VPVLVAYQTIEVPVAAKFATVGLVILQNDCAALPVGAPGLPMVTVTSNRVALSHPKTVCDA
jgi:hypothetical protein